MGVGQDTLVTFVVPVYNVEDYVSFCLNDICGQTYQNIEILVVDDGSTDRSGEICDEFATRDSRIHVMHQENKGLSAARNAGIERASGEYIYFLDSDDRIHPEAIERMLDIARENACQVVQASVFSFIEDAKLTPKLQEEIISFFSNREMCRNLLDGTIEDAGVVQNKLYAASLFQSGLRFPVGRQHEDDALVYRLFWEASCVAVTNQILFFYRSKRPGSIMHVPYNLKRLDALIARKERYMFFQEKGENELYGLALASWCDAAIYSIENLRRSDITGEKAYRTQIKKDLMKIMRQLFLTGGLSVKRKCKTVLYSLFVVCMR